MERLPALQAGRRLRMPSAAGDWPQGEGKALPQVRAKRRESARIGLFNVQDKLLNNYVQ